MISHIRHLTLSVVVLVIAACSDDTTEVQQRTFSVRIENVSTPGTLPVTRLDGVVPLSPGVWAVLDGSASLFTVGGAADAGTERIAEDGDNAVKAAALDQITNLQNGAFSSPGGADAMPTLGPGESVTFTVTATPGQRLQIQTMFAQSNDWFFAFGNGGLALFDDDDDDDPVSGNVTSMLVLYDAGTEDDAAPGTGPNQAPVQPAPNTGPLDETTTIRLASTHPFTIPSTSSVIKVTITPQ
jgi:hypothetical protein